MSGDKLVLSGATEGARGTCGATVISDESLPSYNSDAGLIYGAPLPLTGGWEGREPVPNTFAARTTAAKKSYRMRKPFYLYFYFYFPIASGDSSWKFKFSCMILESMRVVKFN